MKSTLKGQNLQDIEDIQKNVMMVLKAVFTTDNCFQHWQHHWAKCIAAQGEYLKGDPPLIKL
jgi:hypothetical protein